MQLKLLVRHPVYWQKAKKILRRKEPVDFERTMGLAQRTIVLDLYTTDLLFDCGRHFYSIAHYAQNAGSPLIIRCGKVMLSSIVKKSFGRDAIAMPHVSWRSPNQDLPRDALVLRDAASGIDTRSQSDQAPVEMLVGRDRPADYPVMPYPMHPGTLKHADKLEMHFCRMQPRDGILFAGRLQARYGRHGVDNNFQVTSRLTLIEAMSELSSKNPSIVVRDSATAPIDSSEWLRTLAAHEFFVCAPGVAQPLCHNLIEAMSVGTIPIIEYGDRMTPALVDGQQAICFRGRSGFVAAIQRACRMSAKETQQMKARVIKYFDQHLRGEQFLADLRDTSSATAPAKIVLPFHSENFFAVEQVAANRTAA